MLSGERIDRFIIDSLKVDLIESTMICGPSYDVFSIPQEMTKDELKYVCKFYRTPASFGAIIIALGEDLVQLLSGAVAIAK